MFCFHFFFLVQSNEFWTICRAIEESLISSYVGADSSEGASDVQNAETMRFNKEDKELLAALSLSIKEQTEREKNMKLEEEMLQQALRISITDK